MFQRVACNFPTKAEQPIADTPQLIHLKTAAHTMSRLSKAIAQQRRRNAIKYGRGRFKRFAGKAKNLGKKALSTYKNLPPELRGLAEGAARQKLGMGRRRHRRRSRRGRGWRNALKTSAQVASMFL